MNIRPAKSGPYRDRVYYTIEEIEQLTEAELRQCELLPSTPGPINVDLFLEQRFVTPRYEAMRPSLLGYTVFGPTGVMDIVINEELASERSAVAKRRVRTTMAHEGGHALLHSVLHLETDQQPLLLPAADDRRVMCKEGDLQRGSYDGKWWEYQANLAMSSLLLPKSLTLAALEPYLTKVTLGVRSLDPHNVSRASRALSDIFNVNRQVAAIRIKQLFKTAG